MDSCCKCVNYMNAHLLNHIFCVTILQKCNLSKDHSRSKKNLGVVHDIRSKYLLYSYCAFPFQLTMVPTLVQFLVYSNCLLRETIIIAGVGLSQLLPKILQEFPKSYICYNDLDLKWHLKVKWLLIVGGL